MDKYLGEFMNLVKDRGNQKIDDNFALDGGLYYRGVSWESFLQGVKQMTA